MRKNLFSYLFFAVYLLSLVKPIYPVLDYMVNYDYIATQLCENSNKPILDCNGKCYVAKEINDNQKQHKHSLMPTIEFEKYTFKNLTLTINSEITETSNRKTNFYYLEKSNEIFINAIFHPPIV